MRIFTIILMSLFIYGSALANDPLDVFIKGVSENEMMPKHYALCEPDLMEHTRPGRNINPAIDWNSGPGEVTKSYAVIMHDPDVPAEFGDANKEGVTLPATLKRRTFYHWVVFDIPSDVTSLPEGIDAQGMTLPGIAGASGFGDDARIGASGYGGPCPPWNDEAVHHYVFTVYALDVPTLGLDKTANVDKVIQAMSGHVVSLGNATAIYSQNPERIKNYE